MLIDALKLAFEESVGFRLADGTRMEEPIYIGDTEVLPVELLREDGDAYRAEFNRWLSDTWQPTQEERRSEILRLWANEARYTDLCAAVGRRQVVPLVGSGMSAASGLPTWSNLLRQILPFTRVLAEDLEDLIAKAAFEEAADLLADGSNPNLLNERIEHDLRITDTTAIAGSVRLLPEIFPDMVITTNLDDALELYYEALGVAFAHVLAGPELSSYRTLKNPTERFLLKLHGDCHRPSSRVLLTQEYEEVYAPASELREEIVLLFKSNHLLFVGCSLGPDRTVKLIAEVANGDPNMPKHFALLAAPPDDAERLERELFLTDRKIFPIWYVGDHDECLMALLSGLPRSTPDA